MPLGCPPSDGLPPNPHWRDQPPCFQALANPWMPSPPSAFSPSLYQHSPSPIRGLPCSSPTPSALTKSLAASCISQSISQSLAKKNTRLQDHATPHPNSTAPLAPAPTASPLRMRSPSHKLTSGPSGPPLSPGYAHASYTRDGSQPPKCPPSPLRSTSVRSSPCASPAPALSPPPYRSQHSVSPAPPVSLHHTAFSSASPRPRPAVLHQPRHIGLNGNSNNNNNNNTTNGGWVVNHRKPPLASANSIPHPHDPLWSGSAHTLNRVARPFSVSEPSSRVQSPSPSPSPSPFSRICSPPPVQNHTGPLMNKPPTLEAPGQEGLAPSITWASPWSPQGLLSLLLRHNLPLRPLGFLPIAGVWVDKPPRGILLLQWLPILHQPRGLVPCQTGPGKSTHGEQHFTSIAWPDVRELLTKYDSGDSPDQSAPTSPVWPQDEWGDPDLGEDSCRSHLICAYVPRASPAPDTGAPIQYPHRSEPKPEDASSMQAARRTLKTSYATTVNLQIAGSGRITSFSNTQVSLNQTLSPVVDSQGRRRVSINACNFTLPVHQNCKRL
ncbi:uncharacterized protein LOC115128091 [Oncorhynchus nerka]|uniref:uncharacterized protein LOC115128091 n=1 Tax=Oncorhynchus nerka TaxID=8023 RepID=UPI0031B81BB3